MKHTTCKILLTLAMLAGSVMGLSAQTYSVDWFKVADGGGTSTGGVYTATVTIGQQEAGGSISGGVYTATFGFWSLLGQGAPALIPAVPVITSQPQSLFATNGYPVVFNVAVSGSTPLFYQWQKNAINLTDGGNVSGSLTTNLSLNTSLFSAAGSYAVIITNAYGSVTSSVAKLTLILPAYFATDLGTLGGGSSAANGINNSGEVVGVASTTGNAAQHAFYYSGGTMQDLGTLGGSSSYAYGINNGGLVVGYSYTASGYHAFLYSLFFHAMQDLGTFGGNYSYAQGINNSGQVVGNANTTGNTATHAFLYSGSGPMQDLGTLGGRLSYAYGINNGGQVVGQSDTTGNAATHAFLYSSGTMQDLGTLGGSFSSAQSINNSGQVAGLAYTTGDSAQHAFLYSGGTMQDLGTLGGSSSYAYSINISGQVVGYADTTGGVATDAFLYSGGTMFDLNNLLVTNTFGANYFSVAKGINDSGQIVAFGNNQHAYLLTPITPAAYLGGNLTPKIQSPAASGGNFKFSWNVLNAYPAVGYQVQYTTNLSAPNWINLGVVVTGTNATLSATNSNGTDRQRFYRVLLVQ